MRYLRFTRLVCVLLLLTAVARTFPLQTLAQQAPTVAVSTPAQSDTTKRQESFQIVWQTVNDLYYDPTFGGVNWKEVRDRYEPQVAKATTDQAFHELLQRMLNELLQSHFLVIPPEAFPKIRIKKPVDDKVADTDQVDDEADVKEAELLDSLNFKLTAQLANGIGIDLRVLQGSAVVTRVEPGSPGARAGLRPGFVIKKVGDRSLDLVIAEMLRHPLWGALVKPELPLILLAGFINGEPASSVKVGYIDARGRMMTATIKRERLKGELSAAIGNLPSIYTEFESKRIQQGIGYIRFNAFVPTLMEKLCVALRSMKDAPGIVLDLRGNHGGLLGMMGGLAGLLETNPTSIGAMITRAGPTPLIAFPQTAPYTGPLVIIVDGSTESAAEMLAAGLQESGRAIVVGEKSAGNALPSAIKKLPTAAFFQYGMANFITPRGKRLERVGLTPDVTVQLSRKALLKGVDPQLNAAIRELRQKIQINNWIRNPGTMVTVTSILPKSVSESDEAVEPAQPVPVGPPPAPPSNPSFPKVDSLFEKYLEASGGRPVFERINSRVSKGTVELTALAVTGTIEIYEQAPGKSSKILDAAGIGVMQRTFDGSRAWLQDPLQGYIKLTGLGLDIAKQEAIFNRQIRLKELYPWAVVLGQERVDSIEAYVVQMGFEKWYFAVDSGLLLRQGSTHYSDYREVDGVKLPFRIREEAFSGSAVLYQLTEIKHNVEIDPAKFSEYPTCFTKS